MMSTTTLYGPVTSMPYGLDMTDEPLPAGPDPAAITRTILGRYPETDVAMALGATFFSLDPAKHWPNFATIVTTDEHDMGAPSRLTERPGAFRLNLGRLAVDLRARGKRLARHPTTRRSGCCSPTLSTPGSAGSRS